MGTSASVLSSGFGTLQGGNLFIWLLVGWWVGVCSDPSPVVGTIRGLLLVTNLRCGVSAARTPRPILHVVEVGIDTLRPEHRTDICSATTVVLKMSLYVGSESSSLRWGDSSMPS